MKTYLLTAAGVIFLSVIISLIIPEGKMHKSILFVMRMVCIFVLIQPVTGIFKIETSEADKPLYDYEYVCTVYSDNQSTQLEKLIFKEYGEETACKVNVVYNEGKFEVSAVTVEFAEENEKINEIYEYLVKLGYINITVYAKSN
ncbi:MAG: stage III sporulation protein AF [Clostridia bacterium]|nr:stage III sporulation protein AF [Clostridia bacterium]